MYNPDGVAVSLPIYHNHNHGDEDNIAVELRKIMVEEVTPKGLYAREGRVDERGEIYPV